MEFKPRQPFSGLKIVNKFMDQIKAAAEEAKSTICKVQENIIRYYNQRRSLAFIFKPGNKVFLDTSDI